MTENSHCRFWRFGGVGLCWFGDGEPRGFWEKMVMLHISFCFWFFCFLKWAFHASSALIVKSFVFSLHGFSAYILFSASFTTDYKGSSPKVNAWNLRTFFFPPFNSFFFANFGLSSSNLFPFKRISHFEFMQNPVLFHLFSF